MTERQKKAAQLHSSGYNCAQAVACTFCEDLGFDEETVFRLAEGFGLGMGGMQATCGAVSGAVMLAGMVYSRPEMEGRSKSLTYKIGRDIPAKFLEKNGSLICRELKGVDTGRVLRSCPGCIDDAVEIAEEVLDLK